MLERYLGDIRRKFGGHLEEFWMKFAGNVEDVKRRLEGKKPSLFKPYFLISLFFKSPRKVDQLIWGVLVGFRLVRQVLN